LQNYILKWDFQHIHINKKGARKQTPFKYFNLLFLNPPNIPEILAMGKIFVFRKDSESVVKSSRVVWMQIVTVTTNRSIAVFG